MVQKKRDSEETKDLDDGDVGDGPRVLRALNSNGKSDEGLSTNKGENRQFDPRTRIQKANQQIILSAALDVFSTYGFRGSTLDQIAKKSGLSKPNLLYYFSNKEEIYQSVLEETLAAWLEPLVELDSTGDPVDEIRTYMIRKLRMAQDKPEASRLFANEILHGAPAIKTFLTTRLKDLVDEKAQVIQVWIDEGRLNAVNPHHLIFMIWATTQHYADFEVQVRSVLGPEVEDPFEEAQSTLLNIFLNGLRLA